MIPFDLSLLDSNQQSKHDTLHRILQLGQHYMLLTDKSRDAAALLLSRQVCLCTLRLSLTVFIWFRLLTRPDVQPLKVSDFLDWCVNQLISTDSEYTY